MSTALTPPDDDHRRQHDEARRELVKVRAEADEARKHVYALLDHLLEFKTVSLKEAGLSGAELAAKTREELRALPAVTARLREAEIQLTSYRETLKRTDGATFEPRTHAVVCIGLERLVW